MGDGELTLIDCQSPGHIVELQTLDKTLLRPEFSDYSTLNVRRVGLDWLVPRLKLDIGWLTYLTENPHALKATGAVAIVASLWTMSGLRRLLRRFLLWRGWIHTSDEKAMRKAIERHENA